MTQLCLLPSIIAFLLATFCYVAANWFPYWRGWGRVFLGVGAALQTAYLAFWTREVGAPFVVSSGDALNLIAWAVAVIYVVLGRSERWQALGSLVCPLIAFLVVAALHRGTPYWVAQQVWPQLWVVPVHLAAAMVSVAIFAMALTVSALLFFQDYRLKQHNIAVTRWPLPALDSMEHVLSVLLAAGWALLTIVFVTGAIMLAWQGKSLWNRHWLWAIAAWLIYAVVLHTRLLKGWRGRRGVVLSLLGFIAIVLTFLEAHAL